MSALLQVCLQLNELGLESHPSFSGFCLRPKSVAVFLRFNCIRDKNVGDSDELAFGDQLACCNDIANALVKPYIEHLKWFFRIEGFL